MHVWFLGPIQWRERTNSDRLSFDLHNCPVIFTDRQRQKHTQGTNKYNKNIFPLSSMPTNLFDLYWNCVPSLLGQWIIYTDDDIDWRETRAVVVQLLFPHYIGSFSLPFQVINFLNRDCFKYPEQCFQLWQRAGFPFQSPHFMPAADGRWLAQVGIWDPLWVSPEKSLLKVMLRTPVNFAPTLKASCM